MLIYNAQEMKPGAKAFVAYKGKFLLILRDNRPDIRYPNTWNLPGGGVEEGESFDEAMRRELEEEIAVVPKDLAYLGQETYPEELSWEGFLPA